MKVSYNIEINGDENLCGGYLMTTEPMTNKQVAKVAERMGREMLANDKSLDRVSYGCWQDTEDIDNASFVGVILSRQGRKITVIVYGL